MTNLIGKPFPYGVSHSLDGWNFALYVHNALKVTLLFFDHADAKQPALNIEMSRTGEMWHTLLESLPSFPYYAFQVERQGEEPQILLDPYAKGLSTSQAWGEHNPYRPLGKINHTNNFDWMGTEQPRIPKQDLIIYEMHVRGFTQHESSGLSNSGTFLGIIEKIPYLKELGINAVELLPVFEFNEAEYTKHNPLNGELLCNYWGYSTVSFFSLMNRYAVDADKVLTEFKTMVRELHRNGIEVILDVVYNHTAEGNGHGPTYSFRGLDANTYYLLNEDGDYSNFSGCGNTLNTNHPIVIDLIIDSLRYWVLETHIDGFRFDLASVLSRGENGAPIPIAPVINAIAKDPILAETKLIAEAWDAVGLYQVGGFYPGQRWMEWNGRYRDAVRRFIKGTPGTKTAFATAISGSQDVYGWRGSPLNSINFLISHDGFTLNDLVSFNNKQNESNGENNADGNSQNDSWNCGCEGATTNKKINTLRERQMRNFHLALMISQGIPMIVMGDEVQQTRLGNNNTWCQDNALNWFDWTQIDKKKGFYRFYTALIKLRRDEPLFRRVKFLDNKDVSWHGIKPNHPDWQHDTHLVAFTLNDASSAPVYFAAFNAAHTFTHLTLPSPGKNQVWVCIVDTSEPSPHDFFEEGNRPVIKNSESALMPYSAILFKAVPKT